MIDAPQAAAGTTGRGANVIVVAGIVIARFGENALAVIGGTGLAFARAQLHSSRADRRIDPRRPVQGHGPAVAKA